MASILEKGRIGLNGHMACVLMEFGRERGEERSMNVLLKSEYPPFHGRNPPRPDCMFSPWEFTLYSNYSTTPMKPAFTNVAVLVRFIGKGEDRPRPLLSAGQQTFRAKD